MDDDDYDIHNPNPIVNLREQREEREERQDEDRESIYSTSSYYSDNEDENLSLYYPHNMLRSLQQAFVNSCNNESPRVSQPKEITIPLKSHQQALIYAMKEFEKRSKKGFDFQQYNIQSNYGILADTVGAGKSLNILGFISTMKHMPHDEQKITYKKFRKGSRAGYVMKKCTYKENIHNRNLIIVPHTLFMQWKNYIKTQSTLHALYVGTKKEVQQPVEKELHAYDLVLVSNTMVADFFREHKNIIWRRMFIDEADSIILKQTMLHPNVIFTWLVSATWHNIVYSGHCVERQLLHIVANNPGTFHPDLYTFLKNEFPEGNRSTTYCQTASHWIKEYRVDAFFASMFVLRNSDAFLEESNAMPDIIHHTTLCHMPYGLRVVSGFVSNEIHNMIQGGDYVGASQALGVGGDSTMNIVDAVLLRKNQEIASLEQRKSYYRHEETIANINQQIERVREQIKSLKERFAQIENEPCPICLCNPTEENPGAITPCCNHLFCLSCLFQTSLSQSSNRLCPFCRTPIHAQQIKMITNKPEEKNIETERLPTKDEALFTFLKENKDKKILLFSRYDNPFANISAKCDEEKIKYRLIKGNKTVIAKAVSDFEKGKVNVLFLNAKTAGAGLNLIQTTHIILLHKMTGAEEKQVIGRAYRLGRTEPLYVEHMEYENEVLKIS